jgi:anti-sigma factor RsiW
VTPVVPGGISCRELVELVTAYLDGALDPQVVQRIEAHLEACPMCVEYVEEVRITARLAAVAQLELRPDRDALLNAFREFKRGD